MKIRRFVREVIRACWQFLERDSPFSRQIMKNSIYSTLVNPHLSRQYRVTILTLGDDGIKSVKARSFSHVRTDLSSASDSDMYSVPGHVIVQEGSDLP